jgi:hypothetical protein
MQSGPPLWRRDEQRQSQSARLRLTRATGERCQRANDNRPPSAPELQCFSQVALSARRVEMPGLGGAPVCTERESWSRLGQAAVTDDNGELWRSRLPKNRLGEPYGERSRSLATVLVEITPRRVGGSSPPSSMSERPAKVGLSSSTGAIRTVDNPPSQVSVKSRQAPANPGWITLGLAALGRRDDDGKGGRFVVHALVAPLPESASAIRR